jgi:A/G-specific adenine glycosylase
MKWQIKLLAWYQKNKRELPWRQHPTPYRVWISEIMLQQTGVKVVIPYYLDFLKRFPHLRQLARASEEEVLSAWSGLGYYSRARNLKKSAQICLLESKGRLPNNCEDLQKLPGIGRYTAGAIASIAYDQRAALVDGNVARVLSRLMLIAEDLKTNSGKRRYWQEAQNALPKKNCGDYNQALMELGATICTPYQANCFLCPLKTVCLAHMKGKVDEYPPQTKKIVYESVRLSSFIVKKNGKYLMVQRPHTGSLRDLWEFPTTQGSKEDLEALFGLTIKETRSLPLVRHSIMNQRITLEAWMMDSNNMSIKKIPRSKWISRDRIHTLPKSSLIEKVLARLP